MSAAAKTQQGARRKSRWLRLLAVATAFLVPIIVAFQVSPWPAAWVMSKGFNYEAGRRARRLEKHVPDGITELLNEHYDASDPDAHLDVFYPASIGGSDTALATIVWVHGGGWISGSKNQISNYLRVLAARGYTTVAVGYSIAPRHSYPTPARQLNAALEYLVRNAERLHVDTMQFVLAGDSGGAQIAAQLANVITVSDYARSIGILPAVRRDQIAGLVLHCGIYDLANVGVRGPLSRAGVAMMWAYSGKKKFLSDSAFARASVINYITPDYPPFFVSVGNADPLEPQSRRFATIAAGFGVQVDTLFFAEEYRPRLPHEYQFNLDREAGISALDRTVSFVERVTAR